MPGQSATVEKAIGTIVILAKAGIQLTIGTIVILAKAGIQLPKK